MKIRSFFVFLILAGFGGFAIESCKHSPISPITVADTTSNGNGNNSGGPIDTTHYLPKHPCSPDSIYFVNDILPLITSNCSMTGCHDGTGHNDDLQALLSYSDIKRYVKVSNPTSSKLYTVLFAKGEDKMPRYPGTPFSKLQDSIVLTWIKQGALENQCDGPCDTTNVTYSGTVLPIIQVSCLGCHQGSAPSGKISLTNYQEVLAQANNGNLLGSVTYAKGLVGMPFSNKLSDCDINAIRIWIRKGAPNN